AIKLEVNRGQCDRKDWEEIYEQAKRLGKEPDLEIIRKRCGRVTVHVCMVHPLAGQEIILKYVDPMGKVIYRTVKTDENGCFEDFFASINGGNWQVSAEYPGGK